ncbi:MAG: GNAT family N-acetyltransferase [Cyclobacteriaceae bacterium]|nr:GNAT family N-acetyltransferase [Cyclobacteriaceae bacterium]
MKEYVVHHVVDSEKELESLKQFLRVNNLPADDISLNNNLFLVFYNTHEALVGSGGLEFYNDLALLRSLAVSQELRGQQLGKEIVNQLLQEAAQRGIREVYLLTQTASYFFRKLGFEIVAREHVPESIRKSSEFAQVCPAAAEVLKLKL